LVQILLIKITEVFSENRAALKAKRGVGIGVPGKVNPIKGIAMMQNNIPWENFPLVNGLN